MEVAVEGIFTCVFESQSFQRNDIMSMSVLIDNSSRRKTSRSDKRSRLSCQQRVEGDDEIAASRLAYGGRKSSILNMTKLQIETTVIETIT